MAIAMPGAVSEGSPAKADAPATAAVAKTPEEIEADRVATLTEDAKDHPERFIGIERMTGSPAGFGTILELGGVLVNSSPIAIKDPVVECELFAESGTKIDSVRDTIYKLIPPNETVRFAEENMGFVQSEWRSYSCRVVRATVAETG
jgi:hypothetical protein